MIKKTSVSSGVTTVSYPNGSAKDPTANEEFAWDDRTLLNYSLTPDTTAPTLSSAVRDSNTQLTVTLSELADTDSITKSNAGGFIVHETGTPATTYAVSAIAPGATGNKVVLTVATMLASASAGVTIKYTAGGNGTIKDRCDNSMVTDATGVVVASW